MRKIEVEIYLNNFKNFFNKNPEELQNLIGQADKSKFYTEVEKVVLKNAEDSHEFELTQNQIIDIIVMLNDFQAYQYRKSFISTKVGELFLN
jgi:hypothetical protein|tara:strand:- start:380 stop:655 length:276 start_codon:yes stop_codon:yes gene_type:complete